MMLLDYHHKPSSTKYSDSSIVFRTWPGMMYKMHKAMTFTLSNEMPLFSYLKKANSSFYWQAGEKLVCRPSISWTCVNSSDMVF